MRLTTSVLLTALLSAAAPAVAQTIPGHPNQIDFEPLTFTPPDAAAFRYELSNGVPVYLAPDRTLPLINVSFTFKGGRYLDPEDQIGLAQMTGTLMRQGGTTSMAAKEMDERFDFLAAQAGAFVGGTTAGASLNSLKSNFDESFALFMDMVRNPGFQSDRVELVRDQAMEAMKQRNDDASSIIGREWEFLLYGEDHFAARQSTEASLTGITTSDMREMHRRIFNPANLYIAVTGDFEPQQMLDRLESALAGWEKGERSPDVPEAKHRPSPGVYHVEKDIPQGKVQIGQRSIRRDHPDYFPMLIMNDILGGGGFTSRITKKVRSDEGLSYRAGSRLSPGVWYDGSFGAGFDSKNRTVALGIKLIMDEIDRIRNEDVSADELEVAKNSMIETFPRRFESKPAMLGVFVSDEITERPEGFWKYYRDNVQRVSASDIRRVAGEHLNPEEMAILIVGKWDEIYGGDLDGRANMSEFFNGEVEHMPLRDPMTMEPQE